jgi:uncharacterized protein
MMDKLQLYINSRVNENLARQRMAFAGAGLDQKHDRIWCQFGYPENITPEMLRLSEERQAPAKAAVARILDKTWQTMPEVIENEKSDNKVNTPWELLVNKIMRKAYPAIIDADKKNLINKFSAVIIKFRDSLPLSEPVNIAVISKQKDKAIAGYIPAWQEQLTPTKWDEDETSDTYGRVLMWSYDEAAVGDIGEGKPIVMRDIHHSRIIILAEGSHDGNHTCGISSLEAGFNSIIDMQKSQGGAAEGFLKNASRQLHVNYKGDGVTVDQLARDMRVKPEELAGRLNDDVDSLNASIDAAMFTFNADVSPLSVAPADPNPTWMVAANSYAASWRLPFTILFGQQTGRLASDQDQTDYNMRGGSRRVNFVDTVIKAFVDRFAKYQIIETKEEYLIKWDSLLEPSPMNKAETFAKLAAANKAVFESNLIPALTVDEMRQVAGFEPVGEDELPERAREDESKEELPTDKAPLKDKKEDSEKEESK